MLSLRYVSRNEIDMKVVEEWTKLLQRAIQNTDIDLLTLQPLYPLKQTYAEILQELEKRTPEGIEFYRKIVDIIPWYAFKDNIL